MNIAKEIQKAYQDYEAACVLESAAQKALESLPDGLEETPENQKMIDSLVEACGKASNLWWERRTILSQLLQKSFSLNREQANRMMASDKFTELMHKTIVD